MAKKLFQTNINVLNKVKTQLQRRQSMSFTQIILSNENDLKVIEAINAIDIALISLTKIN